MLQLSPTLGKDINRRPHCHFSGGYRLFLSTEASSINISDADRQLQSAHYTLSSVLVKPSGSRVGSGTNEKVLTEPHRLRGWMRFGHKRGMR